MIYNAIFSVNHLGNYTKTIILLRLSETLSTNLLDLVEGIFDNVHFVFGE